MQNVTLHKGALRHPSFGVCMCAPGTVLQENSNTSEIFWDLLRTSQVCFSRDMSWPGYGWSLTRAAALVAWLTLSVNPLVKLWLHPINQNWEKAKKTKKENEEKRAEDDHISFEIFSQKMPEILKWCLCGNTHCTPSVVLLAFWIGQIVFPTSEYLCPELCHNDQLLMTSGKTLVNFSLCDSLWFFVILCDSLWFFAPFLSFSQLCAKCVEKAFSELRFEAGKVTSAAALSGASLVTVVAFFGAFPKPWLYLRQDADDSNGVRSFCDHWKIKHVTLASQKPIRKTA